MRFDRYGRHGFTDSARKRAALARKQQGERDALPLFAGQIGVEQPNADAVMAERAAAWARSEAQMRARRAADWRRARAQLASYPEPVRVALRAFWQRCGWPGSGSYLLSMMHMHDTGRLEATASLSGS